MIRRLYVAIFGELPERTSVCAYTKAGDAHAMVSYVNKTRRDIGADVAPAIVEPFISLREALDAFDMVIAQELQGCTFVPSVKRRYLAKLREVRSQLERFAP